MSFQEMLFVVVLAGGMIGSGVLLGIKTKKWFLLYTYLTFFACFGIWEAVSVATTGQSISQTVGQFGTEYPVLFWVFIGMNVAAWGALMVHFIGMRKKE